MLMVREDPSHLMLKYYSRSEFANQSIRYINSLTDLIHIAGTNC